jgi:hypothetical protein
MTTATADLLPIRQALQFFPSDTRPAYGTLYRWASEGVKGRRL